MDVSHEPPVPGGEGSHDSNPWHAPDESPSWSPPSPGTSVPPPPPYQAPTFPPPPPYQGAVWPPPWPPPNRRSRPVAMYVVAGVALGLLLLMVIGIAAKSTRSSDGSVSSEYTSSTRSASSEESASSDGTVSAAYASRLAEMAVGECVEDLDARGPRAVDCGQPHDAEVYFVSDVPAGRVPDNEYVAATTECLREFAPYVGAPLVRSGYPDPQGFSIPNSKGFNRWMCMLNDLPNKLDRSLRASEQVSSEGVVERVVNALHEGDCFAPTPEGTTLTFAVEIVACDQPHYREVAGVFRFDDGDYPGRANLEATTDEKCFQLFETYVGLSFDESRLDMGKLEPTAETWGWGDRTGLCVVGPSSDADGPLIASTKDSGI